MKRFICPIVALLVFVAVRASVSGDSAMHRERTQFLQQMPDGMQRKQMQAIRAAIGGDCTMLHAVRNARNVCAPVSDSVDTVSVSETMRLYRPKDLSAGPVPLLVYFHGGGWTIGSINSCSRFCNALAETGKVMVLAVDYPLAPEHPYPAALRYCVAAVDYAMCHAGEWGADAARVSVGGDSSGGNLAIAVVLAPMVVPDLSVSGRLRSVVAFYPVVRAYADGSASWRDHGTGYGLDADIMEAFNASYLHGSGPSTAQSPLVSPAHAGALLGRMPPLLLVSAGKDILCDQVAGFAADVAAAGGLVTRVVLAEACHLFITVSGQPTAFSEAVALTLRFLVDGDASGR